MGSFQMAISKFISVNVLVRVANFIRAVYVFIFIAVNFQFQLRESIHGIQIALTANNRSVCRMSEFTWALGGR